MSYDPEALLERMERRRRHVMWTAMIVGLVLGGSAFAYKVVEFLFTLSEPDVRGFAEVPVTVYFFVAAGWLCLLVWSFASGKLANLEQVKLEMLEREAEYESRGE
jgi:hypothetical protein